MRSLLSVVRQPNSFLSLAARFVLRGGAGICSLSVVVVVGRGRLVGRSISVVPALRSARSGGRRPHQKRRTGGGSSSRDGARKKGGPRCVRRLVVVLRSNYRARVGGAAEAAIMGRATKGGGGYVIRMQLLRASCRHCLRVPTIAVARAREERRCCVVVVVVTAHHRLLMTRAGGMRRENELTPLYEGRGPGQPRSKASSRQKVAFLDFPFPHSLVQRQGD